MRLEEIDYVKLLPLPHGWPPPFRPELRRGEDFREAFTASGGLWILFMDGSRYIVPLAHVIVMIPGDWP